MPFRISLFLILFSFFAAAQKSERIHYFEAAIAANYSMSADATQNLPGFGVGVFFHPFSLKKNVSVRFGMDYQLTNMRVASIDIDYSFREENAFFTFNQLRIPVSFPIVLNPKSKVQVYIEPGFYFNIPFDALVRSTLIEMDPSGNVISQNRHRWKIGSNPDFGISLGAGVIFPQHTKRFELRGEYNWGPFGKVDFSFKSNQTFVRYNNLLRLSLVFRFPMKTKNPVN